MAMRKYIGMSSSSHATKKSSRSCDAKTPATPACSNCSSTKYIVGRSETFHEAMTATKQSKALRTSSDIDNPSTPTW